MIEGLQIDVKSAELKSILQDRHKHHEEKAKGYRNQAAELRKVMKDIEEDRAHSKVSSATPAEQMDRKASEHANKAVYFKFMIDHVVQDDTYRLKQEDLLRLGITDSMF